MSIALIQVQALFVRCDMDQKYEKKIGNKIRSLRESRHLTQEQMSAQMQTRGCDVTRSALAKIEVGQRHIYPDELKVIHEILRVDYSDILDQ